MQRILMSLGMVVFVGALAAGATGAFFSDTETSTGNTFAAGELDLKIDNTSYGFDWNNPAIEAPTGVWGPNANNSWQLSDLTNQLFFNFRDLKPGDYGEDTISMHVQNNAWACMKFTLASTTENGVNEPEAAFPDTTVGANEGELQKYLSFLFWYDDGDNVLETGETVIPALSGLPGSVFTGNWLTIADSGTGTSTELKAGVTKYIGKGWCFGTMTAAPVTQDGVNTNPPAPGRTGFTCSGAGNHNDAQTDGISVDVGFYSEQSRNNGQFLCSSLNQTPAPQTGSLTIIKHVVHSGVGDEGITAANFTMQVTGGTPVADAPGAEAPGTTHNSLTPGVYTVSELGPVAVPGEIVTATYSGDCDAITHNVTVVAGQTKTCTVTNTYAPDPLAD